MRMRETAIFQLRSKIWRHHRVPWPRFAIRCGNFSDCAINGFYCVFFTAHAWNGHVSASDLRTFSVDFFVGKANSPPYFYFRFIWPTDLESVPRVEPPTLIISTMFEVDTTIHRRVTALLVRMRYVTWWPWPFNLGQWTNMASHVVNPSTKFEDPRPIHSWLMSYDVRYRPPLSMRLQPLRMRRITWPVRRGKFSPNI